MVADACRTLDMGFVGLGYAKVAFLGVVQGITELLPISSTAHMRIVPALLGWPDPGAAFSAAMQMAALVAVVSYFWSDVRDVASGSVKALAERRLADPHLRLAFSIGLATLPIAIAGVLLAPILNSCSSPLRSLPAIGAACLLMALVLGAAEVGARHRRLATDASLLDAMMVGIAQVGALVPGVSRSGSTLSAALALGFKREEAARYAFLLGVPAIALAGLKELWVLRAAHLTSYAWSVLVFGLVVGAVSAFMTIWGLMRLLERVSAWPFVVYRAGLGLLLLIGASAGWLR